MPSLVKYVRLSAQDANTVLQDKDSAQYDRVFIDKASAKGTHRPQLEKMMGWVQAGDTVVVESYSQFARSTTDLLALIDALDAKGVTFRAQKEHIDTAVPAVRLMLTVCAGITQFERELSLQRQAEGIAIAKQAGRYKGRQPIKVDMAQFARVYHRWRAGDITSRQAMEILQLQPNTFYRRVKDYEHNNK